LYAIAKRLKQVQIENRPAIELIKRVDTEDTFFYVDPPYLHETRNRKKIYSFEMTNDDHIELAECLKSIKGTAFYYKLHASPSILFLQGAFVLKCDHKQF